MHADPGATIERRSGIRAASTLRKLPTASPGASVSAASSTFIRCGLRRARPVRGPDGEQLVSALVRCLGRGSLLERVLLERAVEGDHEVVPVRRRRGCDLLVDAARDDVL